MGWWGWRRDEEFNTSDGSDERPEAVICVKSYEEYYLMSEVHVPYGAELRPRTNVIG